MGAILEKNNKIILVKRSSCSFSYPDKYALPGGFLQKGERIKAALLREIKEETGYRAKIICLFKINDDPQRDRGNVDFIFLAKALEKTADFDKKEIQEVKAFSLNNLPAKNEFAFDHWKIIELFKKWKEDKK